MRFTFWMASLLLILSANNGWGSKALFVQGVSCAAGFDVTYVSEATLIRGNPLTTTTLDPGEKGNWGAAALLSVGREYDLFNRSLLRFPPYEPCRQIHPYQSRPDHPFLEIPAGRRPYQYHPSHADSV